MLQNIKLLKNNLPNTLAVNLIACIENQNVNLNFHSHKTKVMKQEVTRTLQEVFKMIVVNNSLN